MLIVPFAGARKGWSEETQTVVASTMIPFMVTVQIVALPAITGFGLQDNPTTVGYTEERAAVLLTPL